MNCSCGNPVYVYEKGFAGQKPFIAKFCSECLADKFTQLFDEAAQQERAADTQKACEVCGSIQDVKYLCSACR